MVAKSMQARPPELLDIKEAAAFLRVSQTSLRRWTNAGLLPCVRIGGRRERRFRRADLEAFIALADDRSQATSEARHWCGFYSSELSRAYAAAAFLASTLRGKGRCLLVAEPAAQRAVLAQLERDQVSTGAAREAGRLVFAEYHDSPAAQLDHWRSELGAAHEGGSYVTAVGDVSGGALGRLAIAELLEYEAEFDRVIARRFPVSTLCLYDARTLSGLEAAGLLDRHDGYRH
jgi:transcriptional repressor of dcmA and dcmR